MPGFDGRGPRGEGPMTGGGRGYCALPADGVRAGAPFYGRGRGRGWRNCFYVTGMPGWMRAQMGMQAFGVPLQAGQQGNEVEMLRAQATFLKQELEDIQGRIDTLEKNQQTE